MKNKKLNVRFTMWLAFCTLFFTVSCSLFSFGAKENKMYDEMKMVTVSGEKVAVQDRHDVYTDRSLGYGFIIPEKVNPLVEQGIMEIYSYADCVTFLDFYSAKRQKLLEKLNPETVTDEQWAAFTAEAIKYSFPLACVIRVPANADAMSESAQIYEHVKNMYKNVEKIAETKENTYYVAYNTDYSKIDLSDEEKAKADEILAGIADFKKNVFVFPPVSQMAASAAMGMADGQMSGPFGSFSAQTLDGRTVTQDIFKDYKVTMINLWATWCGPCVREMPELAKLHKEMLPEGTNMISVCLNASDDTDAAKEIVDTVSASFTTIIPNATLLKTLNRISAIPTTLFVDSEGKEIGKRITGVPGRDAASAYAKALQEIAAQQSM